MILFTECTDCLNTIEHLTQYVHMVRFQFNGVDNFCSGRRSLVGSCALDLVGEARVNINHLQRRCRQHCQHHQSSSMFVLADLRIYHVAKREIIRILLNFSDPPNSGGFRKKFFFWYLLWSVRWFFSHFQIRPVKSMWRILLKVEKRGDEIFVRCGLSDFYCDVGRGRWQWQ